MTTKMDKKFYGEIHKVKDSSIVPDDQWICFLIKDNAFALTLPTYYENCVKLGCDSEQLRLVREMMERVETWRLRNPEKLKIPDALGERVLS